MLSKNWGFRDLLDEAGSRVLQKWLETLKDEDQKRIEKLQQTSCGALAGKRGVPKLRPLTTFSVLGGFLEPEDGVAVAYFIWRFIDGATEDKRSKGWQGPRTSSGVLEGVPGDEGR